MLPLKWVEVSRARLSLISIKSLMGSNRFSCAGTWEGALCTRWTNCWRLLLSLLASRAPLRFGFLGMLIANGFGPD